MLTQVVEVAFDVADAIVAVLVQIDIGPAFVVRIGRFVLVVGQFAGRFLHFVLRGVQIQ